MTTNIDGNARMVIAAITDRLIYGDEKHFHLTDATELMRLLPPMKKPSLLSRLLLGLTVKGSIPSGSNAGYAAGVGNVSLKGDTKSFEFDSSGRAVFRAGQWRLYRTGDGIEIAQIMADDMDEGRTALLEIKSGIPTRMSILVLKGVQIGPMLLSKGDFQPWKSPSQ